YAVEAFILECVKAALIMNATCALCSEEVRGRQVFDQPVMGFGQQGNVQAALVLAGPVKADLIGCDGLPRPRRTANDVDGARQQSSVENDVQAGDACGVPRPFFCQVRTFHKKSSGSNSNIAVLLRAGSISLDHPCANAAIPKARFVPPARPARGAGGVLYAARLF